MSDDLDDLLRAAMKTLDEQVPSGYFEALPDQTLSRLEGSMQHGSGTTENRKAGTAPAASPAASGRGPAAKEEREEDSGLHDIRNLAASARSRMSNKRIGSVPPPVEDDLIASASGSLKNIALPQPAKMVSLPELAEPEVSSTRKSKKELRAEAALEEAPAASPATSSRFSLPSQQRRRSKAPLFAVLGLGVAAAAGVVIYMQMFQNADEGSKPAAVAQSAPAPTPAPAVAMAPAAGSAAPAPTTTATPPPAAAVAQEGAATAGGAGAAAADQQIAAAEPAPADDAKAESKKTAKSSSKNAPKGKRGAVEKPAEAPKSEAKQPETKPEPAKKQTSKEKAADGEDFDALLKEAGVQDQKKDTKPKLEKKTLSSDDFKKVMGGLEGKAKACYKGTQGNALIKVTVSPAGQISKISVGGEFANKPEAGCIEKAFKSATFPPWDGAPMSYTYAVLLSD